MHQELLYIAQGNNDESVEKVVKFCIENGACLDCTQKECKQLIDASMQMFDTCDGTTFDRRRTVFNLFIQGEPEKNRQLWWSEVGQLLGKA